ncbi:phytoene desaturase [Ornithinimicrobium sp. Arc0846-15]|nr:phytoene desaturase [Ornithinimicrobium laminariae]
MNAEQHATGPDTVVIGGGFAGLATAGLLAQEGHKVTLLEQLDTLGGRSGRWSEEGFNWDTGPSWYLMPEVIQRWFNLMGSSVEEHLELRRLSPAYRTFFQDYLDEPPLDVESSREQAVALFESLDPGSGAELEAYLDSAAQTYELAKEHFLYTDFHRLQDLAVPAVLRRAPRLARLLGSSLQQFVASRFTDPRQRQLLGYPAVFLGTSPDRAPAMYHLMSHLDLTDGVQYPVGGFAALVDAMADLIRSAGVEIITGAEVTSIDLVDPTAASSSRFSRPRPRPHVQGVTYLPRGESDGAPVYVPADVVVGAADLRHLQTTLLPVEQRTPQRRWHKRDPGPSGVLVCLGVRGELPELAHHNLLFTADWQENFGRIRRGEDLAAETSIYVCKTSSTDPKTAPEGCENLFILVPAPALPNWGRGGVQTSKVDEPGDEMVERVAEAAVEQLARWAEIPDLAQRVMVRRTYGPGDFVEQFNAWSGSLLGPGHTLKQSAMFRPSVRDRGVDGLFYAGSSVQPGIGVPMCLISAEVVRDAVRRLDLPHARGDRLAVGT